MKEKCENCKFFGDDGGNSNQGKCKRYPPTAVQVMTPNGAGSAGIYPPTMYNNWCGEWEVGSLVKGAKVLPMQPDGPAGVN